MDRFGAYSTSTTPSEITKLPDQEIRDRINVITSDPAIVSLYREAKRLPIWAVIGGVVGYSLSIYLTKRYSKLAQIAKERPYIYKLGAVLLSSTAAFQLGLYKLTYKVRRQDGLMEGKITEAMRLFAEARKRKISTGYGMPCPTTSSTSCPINSNNSNQLPNKESEQRFNQYGDPIDTNTK